MDYVLGKDLRYDDEHWAPFFKECTPCHINFTFIGQYMFLDTWECPVDQDASFTFDRVEDSALLCTCHQATLRLSTGIFTFWQTKLASLNGTTRMWATLIYKTLLNKDSNPDNNYFTPFLFLQDYFQSATHRKVSEEYFGTVEKDTIRKLYQRWVKQYLRIKTLLTIIFFIKQQEPMVFCSGTNLTLSCLGTVLRITSKWGNQALKTLLKTQP